ncbi:hypothetical protein PUNSTDRAFT_112977 [Punctularia strigosozonata HHB-11173 SS5]|uniref:uncharacterized protein n=1 Tax=Punctularia strigosozonata (strain HHB-11173) TaxID=741275 RepID=UPI000441658D|nr:uncharacterized protein PUNSTDRAFT_112977 [Punctularia strigosozonata HHB-11173 SS5]EIN09514.1 hypothetical protein PUNSTDRAFT_112977 [Punctularia strigosozonata HHB-11173 SS5]
MAFPIPSHLPRAGNPPDISTRILTKVSETTSKTLTATAASQWLEELDESIHQTRTRIHERVHVDHAAFTRQLLSAKSVQERLHALSTNVEVLEHSLSAEETGLMPKLLRALRERASLAQDAANAHTTHQCLAHLDRCRVAFQELSQSTMDGRLADAVRNSTSVEALISGAPAPLNRTEILKELQRKSRVLKDRTEELLNEAYSRSVNVSPAEMTICSSVKVLHSETTITLSEILSSLNVASLASHTSVLRRALTSQYVERVLSQPTSITINTSPDGSSHTLTLYPSPPNSEDLSTRLDNLATVFTFLSNHFFPALPDPAATTFPQSLTKPLTTALLQKLLIPALPSSLAALPPFLELARKSRQFEAGYVERVLKDTSDGEVTHWVDSVGVHYERKRRVDLLDRARAIITAAGHDATFRAELVTVTRPVKSDVIPVQQDVQVEHEDEDEWRPEDRSQHAASVATNGHPEVSADDDGWGFDDDVPEEPPTLPSTTATAAQDQSANGHGEPQPAEDDPADAWGWEDNEENTVPVSRLENAPVVNDDSASNGTSDDATAVDDPWDDPWEDPPVDAKTAPVLPPLKTESTPPPAAPVAVPVPQPAAPPKRATRLEKLAMKGKGGSNAPSPVPSPMPTFFPSPSPSPSPAPSPVPNPAVFTRSPPTKTPPHPSSHFKQDHRPHNIAVAVPIKETYLVSARSKEIVALFHSILDEGKALSASHVFDSTSSSASTPGSLLLQSAPAVLDLFRALYPVKHDQELRKASGKAMRFSNDCLWLSSEVAKVEKGDHKLDTSTTERIQECKSRLEALCTWYFEATIERQESAIDAALAETDGFTNLADQVRFDACENVVGRVLRDIRTVGHQWKGVLTKTKYHAALGALVEHALRRILADVLALDDIPELESHRLSELCKILNALEGLFLDNPEEPSLVVAHVPSWLKYSYLSELLEASLADVTYLFDQGALVDFKVDELVKLVKALFADTPLRANTIHRILSGHPTSH